MRFLLIDKWIQVKWISIDRQGCSAYVGTHAA